MLQFLEATPPTVNIFNTVNYWYLVLGTIAGVVVFGYMFLMIAKNRERPGRKAPAYHHEEGDWGNWKKVVMTICLTGSVLAFVEYQTFAGASLYVMPNDPNALHIDVTGQQYAWSFTYPNGYTAYSNMTVPVNQIVICNVTSKDVTHDFFIPQLDVAKDAQPGLVNQLWFNATQTGVYRIQCKQLCGPGHAFMLANLTVLSQSAYNKWYASLPAQAAPPPPAAQGDGRN